MNPVFRAALRCVAEFVSGREGLRVKVGGREAKTSADGTIVIPFLPADDPEAVILARCYLDHEAAHHRETDFQVWHEDVARETPLVRDLANILEDARVEAAIGRRFLGAAVNLARGLEALVRRGRLQPDPQDPVSLIQGLVMATAREEVAGQRALERVRAEARTALAGFFGEDLPARIEALVVAKGPGMASTADALALAREIAAVLEDATREPPPSGAEEGESEEQSGDSAASDAGDEPESAENANDPARADEPSSDQDDGCEGAGGSEPEGASEDGAGREQGVVPDAEPPEASEEPPGAEGAPGSESPVDGPPEAASENGGEDLPGSNEEGEPSSAAAEAGPPRGDGSGLTAGAEPFSGDVGGLLRDALDEKAAAVSEDPSGLEVESLPETDLPGPGSLGELLPVRICDEDVARATAGLRASLAGLLQARADALTAVSTRGRRLAPNRLYRVAVGDAGIFRRRRVEEEVSVAVVVLSDWSMSMQGRRAEITAPAVYGVMRVLRTLPGVASAAAAFPGMADKTVYRLAGWDEPLSPERFGWTGNGGTPLLTALWWAYWELAARAEERRIVLLVTDGEPFGPDACRRVLQDVLVASGIEVYGLGIRLRAIAQLFPPGSRAWRRVDEVDEVPRALYGMLRDAMVYGYEERRAA